MTAATLALGRAIRRVALGGLGLGLATYLLGRLTMGPAQAGELAFGTVGITFVVLAAWEAWRASSQPSADETAWLLISAGLGVFALCALTFLAVEMFDLSEGWVTAAGMLGLLFRLLVALGILSFPLLAWTARSRWRARLDLVLVGATTAFLAWAWVLSDLFHHALPSTSGARAALFALLDIVLVIMVLMASLRRPVGLLEPTRLLGFGLVFLAVSDWNIATTQTNEIAGTSRLAAVMSFVAMAFIASGAWLASRPSPVASGPAARRRARDLLPIGLCGLALVTATSIDSWDDRVLMGLALASAASLLAWQVAVVFEGEEMLGTLSEQTQRFATLVETAPIAIIETDPEGTVTVVNSEAARILAQPGAALVGQELDLETLAEEDSGLRERVLCGETLRDVRIPIRRPDGETLDLMVSGAPISDRSGEVSGIVWIGADDGPRLRGLAAMIAVQRMQAYEQLTAGIAHDFNNRLAVILGTTEILLDGATGEDEREMLDAVLSAGRRAAALVERLVGTTSRKSDDQEHLDLAPLLTHLEPDLVRLCPPGVALRVEVADEELPVEADWSDLRQAIINLAVNSMEASDAGGTVTVRASLIPPTGDEDGTGTVELVVSDDGAGMDPATRDRIFEPFFTTRVGGGRSRGLGLPAVQGVVLRSRGEIDVSSEAGQGTTVTVRLPRHDLRRELPAPDVPTHEIPEAIVGATILLVDDEPEVRATTGRILRQAGYTVIVAGSADEAMAVVVAEGPIDLLLTDVVMPGRSGIELAEDVTARHPGLPVLLLSGFVGESAHGGLPADLTFPLLSKPATRASLLAAVADLLPVPV